MVNFSHLYSFVAPCFQNLIGELQRTVNSCPYDKIVKIVSETIRATREVIAPKRMHQESRARHVVPLQAADTIFSLPPEIITLFFSYLDRDDTYRWARTCKQAQKQLPTIIANNSHLLSMELNTIASSNANWRSLKAFIAACPQTRHDTPVALDMRSAPAISFCAFQGGIALVGGYWPMYVIEETVKKFPRIEWLATVSIADIDFNKILLLCPSLRSITLHQQFTPLITSKTLDNIKDPLSLESIEIQGGVVSEEDFLPFLQKCTSLVTLNLIHSYLWPRIDVEEHKYTVAIRRKTDFFERASYSQSLRQITIRSSGCTDNGILHILKSLPQLTSLHCGRCSYIHGQGFAEEAVTHTALKELELSVTNIKADALMRIFTMLPNLESLDLMACLSILQDEFENIHWPESLRALDLSCTACSDRTLLNILSECPNLNSLKINCCFSLTDLQTLLDAPTHTSLEELDVSTTIYQELPFSHFLKTFPNLRTLINKQNPWDSRKY